MYVCVCLCVCVCVCLYLVQRDKAWGHRLIGLRIRLMGAVWDTKEQREKTIH